VQLFMFKLGEEVERERMEKVDRRGER
jgi:hypothetical protein